MGRRRDGYAAARATDDVEPDADLWFITERSSEKVTADTAEYWDSPGSKVTQVANLVKSVVTGERYEGDNATVDL